VNAMSKMLHFAAALLLAGCGKEVGRIPFYGEGSNSATAVLSAGKVAFWTDIDLSYTGSAKLEYRVALLQGGSPVATVVCDALGRMSATRMWLEVDRGSVHSRSGRGKMECSATLLKGGPTTVDVNLAFGVRPLSATVSRADLVLKQ